MAAAGLPFSDFLEVVRTHGVPIGISEHQDLAKLLARFDSTKRDDLRDAIAALLARSQDDLRLIRALFDEVYPKEEAPRAGPVPLPRRRLQIPRWALVVLGLLALATAAVVLVLKLGLLPKPSGKPETEPLPKVEDREESGLPSLPPPRLQIPVRQLALIGGLSFGLLFALLWAQRLQHERRRRLSDTLDARLQALPGPDSYVLRPPLPLHGVERDDLEEFATLLTRLCTEYERGSAIDVERTVEQIGRTGRFERPVPATLLLRQAVIVLEDMSRESRLYAWKTSALVHGLLRSSVPLHHYYFDGNADVVRTDLRRGHGSSLPLAKVFELHPSAPVLIISLGTQLSEHSVDWLGLLDSIPRRAWLLPLDAPLPRSPLLRTHFPRRIFGMHRRGLRGVAYALAQDQDRRPGRNFVGSASRQASLAEVERLLRLVLLLPQPTIELAEWLRQRFCPDVPESALLAIVARAENLPSRELRFSFAEHARLRSELLSEETELVQSVRRAIVELLADNEPASGSLAHHRWQIDLAVQRTHSLGPTAGSNSEIELVQRDVAILQKSPLYREAAQALPELVSRLPKSHAPRATRMHHAALAAEPGPLGSLRFVFPGLRELLVAGIGAALIGLVATTSGLVARSPVEHVECLSVSVGKINAPKAGDSTHWASVINSCGVGILRSEVEWFLRLRGEARFSPRTSMSGLLGTSERRMLPAKTDGIYITAERTDGAIAYSRIVKIPVEVETPLPAKTEVASGSLEIKSKPEGAKIQINGKEYGVTPALLSGFDLSQAPLRVTLTLAGYESYERQHDFRGAPTDDHRIEARLSPLAKSSYQQTGPQRDKAAPNSDAEEQLANAQQEYMNGNYQTAMRLAKQVAKANPLRAYRIIGSAACMQNDSSTASDAYRRLDKSAKEYLVGICYRQGVSIMSTEPPSKRTQPPSELVARGPNDKPQPYPIPKEAPAKDAQARRLLTEARMLAESNPTEAAKICRQVMQLYGNNPKAPMVQEAYRQLMSLGGIKDRPSK